jgi:phosphoglycerate dehydrogenase-like enzyme
VALIQALKLRAIGGAALDVFDTEPLPADHAFIGE